MYDLIIGNIDGVRPPGHPDPNWEHAQAVVTRQQQAQKGKQPQRMKVPSIIADDITPTEIQATQEADQSLDKIRQLATSDTNITGKAKFYLKKGILYRKFSAPSVEQGKVFNQLVVPLPYRDTVLRLAHESIMSGHIATKRTIGKVLSEFFWPGVQADTKRFVSHVTYVNERSLKEEQLKHHLVRCH